MKALSLVRKLQLMTAVAIVTSITIGAVCFYGLHQASVSLLHTHEQIIPTQEAVQHIHTLFERYRISTLRHAQSLLPVQMSEIDKERQEIRPQLMANIDHYEKTFVDSEEDKVQIAKIRELAARYQTVTDGILHVSGDGAKSLDQLGSLSRRLVADATPIANDLEGRLKSLIDMHEKEARDSRNAAIAMKATSERIAMGVIVLGVVVVSLLGFTVGRSIKQRLTLMGEVLEHIQKDRDFTRKLDDRYPDELGLMAMRVNLLIEAIKGNLREIASNASTVSMASSRMAGNAQQVASAAQVQSRAATDIASAVEQMAVSVNMVGDQANQAHALSARAGGNAKAGEQVMSQTVSDIKDIALTVTQASQHMQELNTQSVKITEIVSVIRDVADQTNLLALNAAIEAARAGDLGRGFAVVADEVRLLAERTSVSTREITGTITTIRQITENATQSMQQAVERVADGVSRASGAGQAIQEINQSSTESATIVAEMAAAIHEQEVATQSIAVQVEKVAEMAQAASAASAESANASRELDGLANQMQKIVGSYRV